MKAILVVDIDERDLNNDVTIIKFANDTAYYCNERFKPIPQKKKIHLDYDEVVWDYEAFEMRKLGYNQCIKDMLGEEE